MAEEKEPANAGELKVIEEDAEKVNKDWEEKGCAANCALPVVGDKRNTNRRW